jgi:putative CocE/NonD family hydrolase
MKIEWAASQPWSSGKVGLAGISYYAINQWAVAALAPPHLAAICPWEGFIHNDPNARPEEIRTAEVTLYTGPITGPASCCPSSPHGTARRTRRATCWP